MRVNNEGVVGSRGFEPIAFVSDYVHGQVTLGRVIVSGGGGAVDKTAESQARLMGQVPDIVHADWDLYGKIAGKRRNWPLVGRCGHVQAFWDGWSNGAAHAVTAAVALGVPVDVTLAPSFRLKLAELGVGAA